MGKWEKVISSPIRWTGSKITLLNDLLSSFDKSRKYYVEPFLGSGSVLINVLNNNYILKYDKFFVNDSNSNIIEFYKNLKYDAHYFIIQLEGIVNTYNSLVTLEDKSKMFYEIREIFNNGINRSIYFYFLMKTCFNGVYRENKKGYFNVPFGKKTKIVCDKTKLFQISELLQNVEFFNLDYNDFFKYLKKTRILDNAFIYCDPPYIPDDGAVYKMQLLYSNLRFEHEIFCNKITSLLSDNCTTVISMSDSVRANSIYNKGILNKHEIKELFRIVNPKRKFSSKEIIFTNIK